MNVVYVFFALMFLLSMTQSNIRYASSSSPSKPSILVLVDSNLFYFDCQSAIKRYIQDLRNEGFEVLSSVTWLLHSYNPPPPTFEDVKEYIRDWWLDHNDTAVGCILIGHFPEPRYEDDGYGGHFVYNTQLFYMDLDGNWTDTDGDGVYDVHTDGSGDVEPEIWVGRIDAYLTQYVMPHNETTLVNNYFDKNHRYRTSSEPILPRRALYYVDDPWTNESYINNDIERISWVYDEITTVDDGFTTNATDYKNRLTQGYEWLYLKCHGGSCGHGFKTPDPEVGGGWVYTSDYVQIDPHVFFYSWHVCSATDYTNQDCFTNAAIFADTYGLVSIGSIRGYQGFWYKDSFCQALADGKCIGEAFKEFIEGYTMEVKEGLNILGDPTLRPSPRPPPWLTVNAQDQYNHSLTTGKLYLNGTLFGNTGSTFNISAGNYELFVSDFWGSDGYKYCFSHWEDNSTDNPRTLEIVKNQTVTAHYNRSFLRNWSFEDRYVSTPGVYGSPYWYQTNSGWRNVRGDLDGDGDCDAWDFQIFVAIYNGEYDCKADFNGDGDVDALDATIFLHSYTNDIPHYLDSLYSWYSNGTSTNYCMWQWLDNDTVEATKGKNITFSFWFLPESVDAYNGSLNNVQAGIYYEYDGGNNTNYGTWITPTEIEWHTAAVTVNLPSNTTTVKVIIHGNPNFKAWIDKTDLTID